MKKTILAFLAMLGTLLPATAQETITGVVVDKKGNPIPGVWLEIPNTADHTISDLDGTFSITPSSEFSKKLKATYAGMGYKTKKMKDGMRIVMKEYKGWKSVPQEWNWFVEAVVAVPTVGDSYRAPVKPAYGLMAGGVKQWGFYVKGVTNTFNAGECSNYYDTDYGLIKKQTYDYWSASAGFIARLGCPLHLYIGGGYARYHYKVKTLSGEWYDADYYNYDRKDKSDFVFDLGLMFRIKRVTISAGVTGTPWTNGYWCSSCNKNHYDEVGAGNIGIGYSF